MHAIQPGRYSGKPVVRERVAVSVSEDSKQWNRELAVEVVQCLVDQRTRNGTVHDAE